MTDRTVTGLLGVLLAVALALRLIAVPLVHVHGYTSDEREYVHLANRLQSGQGFVDSNGDTSVRAPLFPAVLSVVLAITNGSLAVAHVVNCLLGTVVVGLVYSLSLALVPDRRTALFSAAAAALYPGLVTYSALLQTETLGLLFLLLALLAAVRCMEEADPLPALFLGVAAGCAALTRAVMIGVLPVIVILMWWFRRHEGWTGLRPAVTALVVALLILAPWSVRNYRIHSALVPVSSGGGGSLLTGNNPYATGGWRLDPGFEEWFIHEAEARGVMNPTILREVDRNRLSGMVAVAYMLEHPGKVLQLAVKKSYMFWVYPVSHTDSGLEAQAVAVAGDILLLAGAIFGMVALRRPSRAVFLVAGVGMFFWLVHSALHAEARFRLPVVPFLAVLWGVGVAAFVRKEGRRELFADPRRTRLVSGLLLGLVGLYALTGWLFFQGRI